MVCISCTGSRVFAWQLIWNFKSNDSTRERDWFSVADKVSGFWLWVNSEKSFNTRGELNWKRKNQKEQKINFERQLIEIARDDAKMQRLSLILLLYKRKTTIYSLWISKCNSGLLFWEKNVESFLFENPLICSSENHQHSLEFVDNKLSDNLEAKRKCFRIQSWYQKRFWKSFNYMVFLQK